MKYSFIDISIVMMNHYDTLTQYKCDTRNKWKMNFAASKALENDFGNAITSLCDTEESVIKFKKILNDKYLNTNNSSSKSDALFLVSLLLKKCDASLGHCTLCKKFGIYSSYDCVQNMVCCDYVFSDKCWGIFCYDCLKVSGKRGTDIGGSYACPECANVLTSTTCNECNRPNKVNKKGLCKTCSRKEKGQKGNEICDVCDCVHSNIVAHDCKCQSGEIDWDNCVIV